MDLTEARKLPELAGLDDDQIVDVLHQAYYPDLPRDSVAASLGVKPPPKPVPEATLGDRVKDVGVSLARGGVGAAQGVVGLADMATGGGAGKALEDAGVDLKGAQQYWGEQYSPAQKATNEKFDRAEGVVDKAITAVTNPSIIGHAVVESLPAMAVGGAIGRGALALAPKIGGAVAAGAGEGAIMAGSQAEAIRGETPDGRLTGEQAGLSALTGVAGGAIGAFGVKLANRLGLADVDAMLAGAQTNAKAGKTIARMTIQGAVQEGFLEELPQSVMEQVLQNQALGRPLDQDVDAAAVLGTLAGGTMGGGVNLARGAMAKPTVDNILNAPDVDSAIAATAASIQGPAAPIVVAPPVDSSVGVDAASTPGQTLPGTAPAASITEGRSTTLTGTDPAALLERPDDFMAAARAPRSVTGTTAPDLLASQPQDPIQAPAREGAVQREDQRQDDLADQAVVRMRREVDSEAQALREFPARTLPRREPTQPELDAVVQEGDILDKAGAPFKELAAKLRLKNMKGQGTLVAVQGGWIVRPKKETRDENQADRAGRAGAAPAPVAAPAAVRDGGLPPAGNGDAVRPTGRDDDAGALRPQGDTAASNAAPAAQPAAEPAGPVVGTTGPGGDPAPGNGPELRPNVSGLAQGDAGPGQAGAGRPDQPLSDAVGRDGLRDEDRYMARRDSAAGELAMQVANDSAQADFDPKEVPQALAQWAKDAEVAEDDFREAFLKGLRARKIKPKTRLAIEKAIHPLNVSRSTVAAAESQSGSTETGAGNVQMRSGERAEQEDVRAVPRGVHEGLEKQAPTDAGAAAEGQRPELRRGVSAKGQDQAGALPVRGGESGNAPRGLQQASAGAVAVPSLSPEGARNALTVPQRLFVQRGTQKFEVADLREASQKWQTFQDTAGAGVSEVGNGVQVVDQDGKEVAQISFNGRVWPPGGYKPGTAPLLEADGSPGKVRELGRSTEQVADQPRDPESGQFVEAVVSLGRTGPEPSDAGARARARAWAANPLKAFLGQHGIYYKKGKKSDYTLPPTERRRAMVQGYPPIFRSTGKGMDMLAEAAVQAGFLLEEDPRALADLIDRALTRGERIIPQYAEGALEQEVQARMAALREAEEALDELPAPVLAELEDNEDDIPWDAPGNIDTAGFLRALGATEQEIADEIANEERRAQENAARARGTEQGAGAQAQGVDRQGAGQAQEGLSAPTREDIERQQDRAARAQDLDDKAQIEREAGGFALQPQSGERREDNTGDMFGGPSAQDVLAARSKGAKQPVGPDLFDDDGPQFAQGTQSGTGMQTPQVQALADTIAAEWSNAPTIVALPSIDRAPDKVQDDAKARMARGGGRPKAVFYRGTVYLFSDALRSEAEAAEFLIHEVEGHFGMRGHFGPDLDRELDNVVRTRRADIEAMYQRTGKERSPAMDLRMAEEVVAYLAQTRPELGTVKRVIAAIRNWLRDHVPGFKSLTMSDGDIIQKFILSAQRFVRGEQDAGDMDAQPAFGEAAPAFYSALSRGIAANPASGLPSVGWIGAINSMVNKGQAKADEVEWSGVVDWLKTQQGKIPKDQVLAFLDANGVRVQEVVHGGRGTKDSTSEMDSLIVQADALGFTVSRDALADYTVSMRRRRDDVLYRAIAEGVLVPWPDSSAHGGELEGGAIQPIAARMVELAQGAMDGDEDESGTRYSQYTLPGGENYRELLLTLPADVKPRDIRPPLDALPDGWDASLDTAQPEGRQWAMIPPGQMHGRPYGGLRASTPEEARAGALQILNSQRQNEDRDRVRDGVYSSGHWSEPNVLAHIRLKDRTDADGKRVLFVEEIQSDWAQKGREHGFAGDGDVTEAQSQAARNEIVRVLKENDDLGFDSPRQAFAAVWNDAEFDKQWDLEPSAAATIRQNMEVMRAFKPSDAKVPVAPFVGKTDAWVTLALKRIVKMAVDEGYDRVAFVTGQQSADRYSLETHTDRIQVASRSKDALNGAVFNAFPKSNGTVLNRMVNTEADLEDLIGKEVAQRLMAATPRAGTGGNTGAWVRELSGLDLKVGGEGMMAFYDKIIPSAANKLLAKIGGGKMGAVAIETEGMASDNPDEAEISDDGMVLREQPGFTITPAMRETAGPGLPLFGQGEAGMRTVQVDGQRRPDSNSKGQVLHPTFQGQVNFWRFMGDSKVVDEHGRPLVMYHGTDVPGGVSEFSLSEDGGYHFGPASAANERLALTSPTLEDLDRMGIGEHHAAHVMPVYLAIRNPLRTRDLGDDRKGWSMQIKQAKAAGHDGLVYENEHEGGGDSYVAFAAKQIKSATGNNGQFDPESDNIMFAQGETTVNDVAPSGQAASRLLETLTIENVRKHAGYRFTDYRTLGLGMLGRRQITELYAKDVPELAGYSELAQQMEADKNEEAAAADSVAREWGRLKDERQLAELMHDATLAQLDPARDYVAGDSQVDYDRLRQRWDALSPEAQGIYLRARDMYEEHYARVREAMRERIERAEITDERKADLLARMDGEFFDRVKGVYFPLARFGKYVVVVKDKAGDTASVSRAETMAEASASREAMQKAFPEARGFKVGKVLLAAEFNASRDGVGRGFLKSLFNVLDEQGVSDELQDAINQLYLSSLPDLSWAKHGIHRKGTPGFSQDARRAFAQNMFHGARYLAKLRYADQLQGLLDSMEKTVKAGEEADGFDAVKARQVVDEMTKRHDLLMNPKTNPLSTALTSIGFVFHMGLSPASALVNLSQTGLVAYPVMGSRWGFAKAGKALLEASREAAVSKNDLGTTLKGDELKAFEAAVKAGTIDVTLAHDLAGIAQGEDSKVAWKMRPVMRAASFLFHHAERFNRQVTFIAAYRLLRDTGAGHESAYRQATQVTYESHFDYGAGNRPRFMQGNMARVLLLFKQFAQNMVYTLSRQAYLSMKGLTPQERALARKTLAGLLVSHAAGAGVLGLPLVGTLLAAASFLGSDDDEPWDAEVALRNLLADSIGQKPAEALARGLSRLTPIDISGRVGLDRLILPDVQEGLEGVRLAESMMAAALGPVAGIGINAARGVQKISEGDWARGLEDMMPSALRGPLKAARYGQEGAIDKTGIPIVDNVGPLGVLGQALGFSPAEVREATEGKSAIRQLDSRISERRRDLLQQYSKAVALGDDDGAADAREQIQEFNRKQPEYRIKPESMLKSVQNRRRRIADAEDGVYLPRGRKSVREAGQFARGEE